HRLVVAVRHLSDQEVKVLEQLGDAVPCFELQRFEAADVRQLAIDRLGDTCVEGFLAAVDKAGMAELVRIPLVAAMACQLYSADPDQPLGSTRGEIYDRFMVWLMSSTPGDTGMQPEHHLGRPGDCGWSPARYGPDVQDQVLKLATLPLEKL